jgi:hypothetical protein
MNTPQSLEQLLALEACRQLVQQTVLTVDAQDYAAYSALFTPEGVLERPDGSRLQGRVAIETAYRQRDPDRLTQHLISNHLIDFDNPSLARSRCTVQVWSGRRQDVQGPRGRPAEAAQLLGEFMDELVWTADGWRVRQRLARFNFHRTS